MIITFYDPMSIRFGGGGERWLLEVSKRLYERGHEVNLISLKYAPELNQPNFEYSDYLHYLELPYIKLPRGFPVPSLSSINLVTKKFNDSDVVYFYVCVPNEVVLRIFKSKLRSPLIGGIHGFLRYEIPVQRLYIYFIKHSLKVFDAFHVLNSDTKNLIKNWGYQNVYLIPNGVDTRLFQSCDSPTHSSYFNILYTGRLATIKGTDILIKIIHYLNEKSNIRNINFTIVGTGPIKGLVTNLTRKYNNVRYLGFIHSTTTLARIYQEAHLFLIPSRTEGLPLSLLEAQSCGLPVVGSKIPGISDVIIDGKTGHLINVGDIKSFAEVIEKYYELWRNSPQQYSKLNRTIREHIVKNYDWSIVIDRLEKMFQAHARARCF
jgi:glycosyltransferase involved in cell wall biosynthesis